MLLLVLRICLISNKLGFSVNQLLGDNIKDIFDIIQHHYYEMWLQLVVKHRYITDIEHLSIKTNMYGAWFSVSVSVRPQNLSYKARQTENTLQILTLSCCWWIRASCTAWLRTSRGSQRRIRSWFQGKVRRCRQSRRWSPTMSSLETFRILEQQMFWMGTELWFYTKHGTEVSE